jgi:serine phosphatase RsbU (regulator of sigma subunit)
MPDSLEQDSSRRLADRLLAPTSRLQRYRWLVLATAAVLEIMLVLVVNSTESVVHPLDPVGAGVVLISVVAAAVSGAAVGLGSAVVGVIMTFVFLADFANLTGAENAIASAILWCVAASATGLVAGYFRRQVARREAALKQALGRSLSTRDKLERVLEFSPQFHLEGDLATVAHAICETAIATFGPDSARLYALEGSNLELLGLAPAMEEFKPGLTFALKDYPDMDEVLRSRRPSFQRDVRHLRLKGAALHLQHKLPIISAIRIPMVGATGVIGLLSLSWDHLIGQPGDELLAIMQRFADQAALAWQGALRVEAQKRADDLRLTLDRVLALAPSFHISGSREEVAEAICEAAIVTFECTAAALYRVEADRIRLLSRLPCSDTLKPGLILPLGSAGIPEDQMISGMTYFVPELADFLAPKFPWTPRVIDESATRSALFVPLRVNERGPRNLLVLAWDHVRETPDENTLVVVQRFADQAALALTNASAAQLHARLEASLLPASPAFYPGLRIVTRYRTGEHRLSLGGDFVGTTVADDGTLNFVVGDVSGHGPNAAALGATLRVTWRALAMTGYGLTRTLAVMNTVLLSERTGANAFATLVAAKADLASRKLTLINAGHLPPILVAGGDAGLLVTKPSPPLGFGDPSQYQAVDFNLPEAWTLMCYTDGIIDAHLSPHSDERFGEDRLIERLRSWPTPNPDETLLDALLADVEAGNGGPFADDVAVLLISTDSARGRS